jgi:hypothetical protein
MDFLAKTQCLKNSHFQGGWLNRFQVTLYFILLSSLVLLGKRILSKIIETNHNSPYIPQYMNWVEEDLPEIAQQVKSQSYANYQNITYNTIV